jgi:RND superfamily putative drug exporter
VQRRPLAVVTTVVVLLLAAAVPALGLRTTSSGTELLPSGNAQRVFFEDLARDYPAATSPEVTVVGRASLPAMAEWARTSRSLPGVVAVDPPRQVSPGVVAVGLRTATGPTGDEARALVTEVRADRPPFPSWATGQAAALADFDASVLQRAPIAIGLVALATFVLLFLMTGSLVLPLKALLLNVVSLGASLGALVWVFQHGHLEWLIGFDSVGAIESTIPLLLFAFGFGLSMDYEVFLLSRIVELHEQGYPDGESVVLGLQRSGRIITSAAVLIVIVFGGFVAGQLLVIKETGVALAFAVALDATLVRMLLVPATMTLLGRWNWWAPAPLRRWHARHGITEEGAPTPV